MVCYARPASRMAAVVLVLLLVFGRHVGHFFDAAALIVAITVAAGGAAVVAAAAFAAFLSIRRRRAAAGGCVSCQLRCQHAMTEQPRRLLVVSAVERGPVAARNGTVAARGGSAAPRWPDRPAYRSAAAGQPGGDVERRRAETAVLPDLVLAGPARGEIADAAGQRREHGRDRAAGQLQDQQGYGQDGQPVTQHGNGLTAQEHPRPQHYQAFWPRTQAGPDRYRDFPALR